MSLKLSQRWELRFFSGVFWACIQTLAFAWPSKFPRICGGFSEHFLSIFLLPQLLHSQASWSIVCPNYILWANWPWQLHFPLNALSKCPLGSCLNSGEALKQKHHVKPLRWPFRNPPTDQTTQPQFFKNEVCIVPSVTSNLRQQSGLPSQACCRTGLWRWQQVKVKCPQLSYQNQ